MQRYAQRDRPLRNHIYIITALMMIYSLFHLAIPLPPGGLRPTLSTLLAGNAYLLMATSIFLANRPRFLENTFGGLDKMYQAHKFCGIMAGVLVLGHYVVATKVLPPELLAMGVSLAPSKQLGMAALIALFLLLALALNRSIAYHQWRKPHKLMGLVFILTTAHFTTVANELFVRFGPAGIILLLAAVVGIVSYLANIFGFTAKNGKLFTIEKITLLERATEIILKPRGEPMQFTPGQFAFLEIHNHALSEPHPFTIASAPQNNHLHFTIKSLGDWSRQIRGELALGQQVTVRGPYGRFDGHNAGPQQIWFAAGIGITPFLSMLRDISPHDKRIIRMVYAVRELKDALFLPEIKERISQLDNVDLVLLQSSKGQYSDIAALQGTFPHPLSQCDIFLCGPGQLVKTLSTALKRAKVSSTKIHTEAFEFR